MLNLQAYLIGLETTVHESMACIDRNGKGIALVVDGERQLVGTVSDGDVRRAILRGVDLDLSVGTLLEQREVASRCRPLTALHGTSDAELLHLMNKHEIRQIPIVDISDRVVDMAFLSDLVREYELPLTAVVMAGGSGSRLRPLTDKMPKPMLPLGDRPMLERTIERLRQTGIHRVSLTTHYRAEEISNHFGNGKEFGVAIDYVHEDQPLGTAGAIGLLGQVEEPLLVINGDVLTNVDYRAMLNYHRKYQACLTVGVRQYDLQVPYGVMECNGHNILGVSEKPVMHFLVNAGVYLLEPDARQYIPVGRKSDMTDLIQSLIRERRTVVSFPIVEYWLDIGQHPDYNKAQSDFASGRFRS